MKKFISLCIILSIVSSMLGTFTVFAEEPPTRTHTHKICGDENCMDNHEDIEWTAWNSTDILPEEEGNYYLTKDIILTQNWQPTNKEISLCLNGHIITVGDYSLWLAGTIILTDCSDTIHKISVTDDGLWVLDEQNGTEDVTGGVITGHSEYSDGAAITIPMNYIFNMFNINIIGNKAYTGIDASGLNGAVYVGGGTFNMYSGRIMGNIAKRCGGGVGIFTGTFNMYNGEIGRNIANCGGGVYNCGGTFNMYDGKIIENTSTEDGGVNNVGTMTVGGTSVIKDNNGGNVYVYEYDSEYDISFGVNNPLSDGAYIGITYGDTAPTEGNPVDITGANAADYSQYFHSDDGNYKIVNGKDNVIQLAYDNKINAYVTSRFSYHPITDKTPRKITSYSELQDLNSEPGSNRRNDYLLEQYPQSFFEDKFLYVYYIGGSSDTIYYTVTKAAETTNYINIEILKRRIGRSDVLTKHFLFVEADKSLLDKELNVIITTDLYEITDMHLTDENGNEITKPEKNKDFTVNMNITNKLESCYDGYFYIAVYGTDGTLIDLKRAENNAPMAKSFLLDANIQKTDKDIGEIKLFVWSFISDMQPLAKPRAMTFME